ncbi:MAG: hypothetical protein JW734_00650 [Candidatus Omnitrophica bacterium]|nr:hypothetical protein [Candidatus Omnitrophota bacterium]
MSKKDFVFAIIPLVLYCGILIIPAGRVYAQTQAKAEPVAQVYEVVGNVLVERPTEEASVKVNKGFLVSSEDILILKKGSLASLYFKKGGKKTVEAKEKTLTYKVADLAPKIEAYEAMVPSFGATREIDLVNMGLGVQTLFYPQETLIVSSPPLIELTIFDGSGDLLRTPKAMVKVLDNDKVLSSQSLDNLTPEVVYTYSFGELDKGKEYSAQVDLDIAEIADEIITFSFNFFIADAPDKNLMSGCTSFADTVYRSLESTSAEHAGKAYRFWFIKRLEFREGRTQPIIPIEIIIK